MWQLHGSSVCRLGVDVFARGLPQPSGSVGTSLFPSPAAAAWWGSADAKAWAGTAWQRHLAAASWPGAVAVLCLRIKCLAASFQPAVLASESV